MTVALFKRRLSSIARSILRQYNGTLFAPVLGVNVYSDSAGSTLAVKDGVVGCIVDTVTPVGPELVVNGDFSNGTTGWTAAPGTQTSQLSNGAWRIASADGSAASVAQTTLTPTVGKAYRISLDVVSTSGSGILVGFGGTTSPALNTTGTKVFYLACSTTVALVIKRGGVCNTTFDNISVREVGLIASQATAGYKPYLRVGAKNLMLQSAALSTQSVTVPAVPMSLAIYGTGSVTLSGTGSGTLAGTGASDRVVLSFTPTAGGCTFTVSGSVTSAMLVTGTYTTNNFPQYVATTTAPASNGIGPTWLDFDGVDDRLRLSAVPFQMADDHFVTAGVQLLMPGNYVAAVSAASNYATAARAATLGATPTTITPFWTNDAVITQTPSGSIRTAGEKYCLTGIRRSSALIARKNGIQLGVGTALSDPTTLDIGLIGHGYGFSPWSGPIYAIALGKGAITDAQLLLVERYVGQLSGVQL